MGAATLQNPRARPVMGRIFALNDSTSALLTPCSAAATIAERYPRIRLARRTKAGMQQRCAKPIQ